MKQMILVAFFLGLAAAALVAGQGSTLDLTIPEVLKLPINANRFSITNAALDARNSSEFNCDNPVTIFAPTDSAWSRAYVGTTSPNPFITNTEQLLSYWKLPFIGEYAAIEGSFSLNALLPPVGVTFTATTVLDAPLVIARENTLNGAFPLLVAVRQPSASNGETVLPEPGQGTILGVETLIDSSVQQINACGGSVIYVIDTNVLEPPLPQANSCLEFSTTATPACTNIVGTQRTDLLVDEANGFQRGLPVCTIAGVRRPFEDCECESTSTVLENCEFLNYPRSNSINSMEMREDIITGATPANTGSIPGAICQGNYGPNGITFSLTLLNYCDLRGTLDDDDADVTVFLPTNAAWYQALLTAQPPVVTSQGTVDADALFLPPYNTYICDLIKYHAVPGKLQFFDPDSLLSQNNSTSPTLQGEDVLFRTRGASRKVNESFISFLSSQSCGAVIYRLDFPLSPSVGPSAFGVSPSLPDFQED